MFSVFSEVMGRPWKLLGAVLCTLTGTSSVFIARVLAVIAVAVSAVWLFAAEGTAGLIFTTIFSAFITRPVWKNIAGLEREAKSTSDVLGDAFRIAVRGGGILTIGGLWILTSMHWFAGYGVGLIISAGALYIAAEHRPKKRSLLKRAISWLKAHLPHIGTRSPAPIPT
jgi:hypothetical protein